MNMKIKFPLLFLLIISAVSTHGQGDAVFSPGGKPVFLVFSNIHSDFNKHGSNEAFELTRVYLGYEYNFSRSLSARINVDAADPKAGELQLTAYIKNAFLQYKNDKFSGRMGMIGTDEFSVQEKHWGYRYLLKSFQDEYGFGPSADLGAAVEYSPSKIISFDASVLNGEGYKKLQSDSTFKYTLGLTIKPVQGLVLRGYTDIMKRDYAQNTLSFFAGYTLKSFRTGLEYSMQKNNKMINEHDLSGISAYAALGFAKKFSAFVRYDYLTSTTPVGAEDSWNYAKDGQLFVTGLDFAAANGIRIAPAYFGWLPADHLKAYSSRIGLYFEIKI
jgi:hypothetical protein